MPQQSLSLGKRNHSMNCSINKHENCQNTQNLCRCFCHTQISTRREYLKNFLNSNNEMRNRIRSRIHKIDFLKGSFDEYLSYTRQETFREIAKSRKISLNKIEKC